jgi:hypothetical protein
VSEDAAMNLEQGGAPAAYDPKAEREHRAQRRLVIEAAIERGLCEVRRRLEGGQAVSPEMATALGDLATEIAMRPPDDEVGGMKTAQQVVQARYPDAVCVRTMFGLAVVAGRDTEAGERKLGEVRGAAWPEEAWIEAAASVEFANAPVEVEK